MRRKASLTLRAFIGLVLLATAGGKLLDVPGFARVLAGYDVFAERILIPLAVALLNPRGRIMVDAVLTTEDELSHVFSFTRCFGLRNHSLSVRATGAILQNLKETQPDSLSLLTSLRSYSINEFMTLDASTRRNLELAETLRGERKGSLLGTLDRTVTPMGKRLIHQWVSQPLLSVERIERRLNGVQYFFEDGMKRAELRVALKPLADLERLDNRVLAGLAQPRDRLAMRDTLARIPGIVAILGERKEGDPLLPKIETMNDEFSILEKAIDDDSPSTLQNTGVIRAGYSQELDSIIEASRHAREWIANLESLERERTGIKTLKVGYNKVFPAC